MYLDNNDKTFVDVIWVGEHFEFTVFKLNNKFEMGAEHLWFDKFKDNNKSQARVGWERESASLQARLK